MKKIYGFLTAVAVLAAVTIFNACGSTDKCESVNCGLNGVCNDGTCVCDAGYEGTNCETQIRQKYLGTWLAKENPCSYDSCGKITAINCPNYNITIIEDPNAKNKFILKDLGNYPGANIQIPAKVTTSTEFTLDTTDVGTINPVATFYGNGTYISSNKVIVRYTVKQGCEKTSAVDTLSK